MRSGSTAFRPCEPKFNSVPPLALPWMRPLKALRYFVRLGCNICQDLPSGLGRLGRALLSAPAVAIPAPATAATLLRFHRAPLGGHGIVLHDLALEDPHL